MNDSEGTFHGIVGCFFVLFICVYVLVEIWAGYLGIAHHLGAGWAVAAIVLAFLGFSLPLTIGSFFGAMSVWGWHWLLALVFATLGLAFMALSIPATLIEQFGKKD